MEKKVKVIEISEDNPEILKKEISEIVDSILNEDKEKEPKTKLNEDENKSLNDAFNGLCTFIISLTNDDVKSKMKEKCEKLKTLPTSLKGLFLSFVLGEDFELCKKFYYASDIILKIRGE